MQLHYKRELLTTRSICTSDSIKKRSENTKSFQLQEIKYDNYQQYTCVYIHLYVYASFLRLHVYVCFFVHLLHREDREGHGHFPSNCTSLPSLLWTWNGMPIVFLKSITTGNSLCGHNSRVYMYVLWLVHPVPSYAPCKCFMSGSTVCLSHSLLRYSEQYTCLLAFWRSVQATYTPMPLLTHWISGSASLDLDLKGKSFWRYLLDKLPLQTLLS